MNSPRNLIENFYLVNPMVRKEEFHSVYILSDPIRQQMVIGISTHLPKLKKFIDMSSSLNPRIGAPAATRLVYFQNFDSYELAKEWLLELNHFTRIQKERLIIKRNPNWSNFWDLENLDFSNSNPIKIKSSWRKQKKVFMNQNSNSSLLNQNMANGFEPVSSQDKREKKSIKNEYESSQMNDFAQIDLFDNTLKSINRKNSYFPKIENKKLRHPILKLKSNSKNLFNS